MPFLFMGELDRIAKIHTLCRCLGLFAADLILLNFMVGKVNSAAELY
jgi:hypothetical protein